jgi:hypothetical protein
MRLDPPQNDIPLETVKKNPSIQLFSTEAGRKKRVFPSPISVGTKWAFSIDKGVTREESSGAKRN